MSDRHRRRRPRTDDENAPLTSSRHRYMTRSATRDENDRPLYRPYWTNRRRVSVLQAPQNTDPPSTNSPIIESLRAYLRQLRSDSRSPAVEGARDRERSLRNTSEAPSSSTSSSNTRNVGSRSARISSTNRQRSGGSSDTRHVNEAGSSRVNLRIRSYAAMSTGGRANVHPRPAGRAQESDSRRGSGPRHRITASIRLHRRNHEPGRSVSHPERGTSRRRGTGSSYRIPNTQERQRQRASRAASRNDNPSNDDEFAAVMRSLELVRSNRQDEATSSYPLVHFLEETTLSEPRPRATTTTRRSRQQRAMANLENLLASHYMATTRAARRQDRTDRRLTRNASARNTDAHVISYNVPEDNGINIRFAFDTDEDDNELVDPTFSLSGDSDATTFLNSISDGDMSTDDVFYSESDRVESDSEGSIESASTATPHSLVSLSLNALHPSPTPSLSSAETDVNVEEEDETNEDDEEDSILERTLLSNNAEDAGNPIIFLHNNISVHLLSSMAELADAFTNFRESLLSISETHDPHEVFRGFAFPRYNNLEPTQRRVPEGVDCQRAKLIDELNSNTAECIICTDPIRSEEQVWPCNNCFNIFHLPCIRRWAKTNRDTEMGGAWICPVCRRPKFCSPNRLRYRCLCGRLAKPKPTPGVTPHCCGEQCKHNCGLLCHPGPCKMTEAETAAVMKASSSGNQQDPAPENPSIPSESPAASTEVRPAVQSDT